MMRKDEKMKKILALLLTFALSLTAVACVEKAPPKDVLNEKETNPAADKEPAGDALTDVKLPEVEIEEPEDYELYDQYLKLIDQNAAAFGEQIVKTKAPEGNWVMSPLSAWLCYELFLGGTTGQVEDEVLSFLESQNIPEPEQKLAVIRHWLARYQEEDVATRIENLLLIKNDSDFKDSYLDYATNFHAKLFEMNLPADPDGVTAAINKLIAERTFDIIPKFYEEPLDAGLAAILLNIVAMDVLWDTPFVPDATEKDLFTLEDGNEVEVDMMHQTTSNDMLYYKDDFGEYVSKPYVTGENMVLMLPAEGVSLEDLIRHYNEKIKNEYLLEPYEVTIALPKFEIESDYGLKDILISLGMEAPFDPAHDTEMMGFIDGEPMVIDDSKQVAKIEVFEEGTRAAAVTSIEVRTTSMQLPEDKITIEFNRPFAFSIQDREIELFRGVVMDPTK